MATIVTPEYSEKKEKYTYSVDENGNLAQEYGVRGLPTIMFFKNGEPVRTLVGLQSKMELIKSIDELA